MANSGTVAANFSKTYSTACWSFEWTQTATGAGISRIDWKLYSRGRKNYSSDTILWGYCELFINGSQVKSNVESNSGWAFTDNLRASGSFNVSHEPDGSGTFTVKMVGRIYETGENEKSGSGTLDLNYPYTACGAPTSVTASGIITPSGEFTVSWSGATNGTANNISGYRVYYNISSNGTAPTTSTTTYEDVVGSNVSSTKITLSNATRGYKVVCGVVARGTVSGYDSPITTGGSVTINTLPGAPTLSNSNTIIPSSSGSSITFRVTKGADSDGQTTTLYYKKDGGDRQLVTGTSFSVTDPGTYEFETYDGLEYSSVTSRTFIPNTKPQITMTVTGTSCTRINYSGSKYVISPVISLTKSGGQSLLNRYTYWVQYGTSSDRLDRREILSSNNFSTTLSVTDIRKIIGVNKYYRLYAVRNDSVENSDTKFSDVYYIPALSTFEQNAYPSSEKEAENFQLYLTNKVNSTRSTTNLQGYYSNGITVMFYRDSGYDQVVLGVKNSDEKIVANIRNSAWSKHSFVAFNFDDRSTVYVRGNRQTFQIAFKNSKTGFVTDTIELKELHRTTKLASEELAGEWSDTIDPYTINGSFDLSFRNFFKYNINNASRPESYYNDYGFNSSPTFSISASYNGVTKTLSDFSMKFLSDSTAYIQPTADKIYDLFKDLGMNKDSKSTYTISLQIYTSNVFGEVFKCTLTKAVNWTKDSILSESDASIKYFDSYDTCPFLKEGVKLNPSIKISSYHGAPTSIRISCTNNNKIFHEVNLNSNNFTVKRISQDSTPTQNSPVQYQISFSSIISPQSEDLNGTTKITCVFNNGIHSISHDFENNLSVYKQTTGMVKITAGDYDDKNQMITITTHVEDYGVLSILDLEKGNDGKSKYARFFAIFEYKLSDNEAWKQGKHLYESSSGNHNFATLSAPTKGSFILNDFGNNPFIICRIHLKVDTFVNTSPQLALRCFEFYSNEFIIYNSMPTVSYRPNRVGINYDLVESHYVDGALVVNAHNNVNKIYLIEGNKAKSINIATGQMSNFIVNGGSWDELADDTYVVDEILSLATIARTGDIADLVQKDKEIMITFCSGDSIDLI